jgi:hypothetical protein
MIQNERQYRVTRTKLREFEQELATLNLPDLNIHPRQIMGWTNSLNIIISELKQEVAEYEQLNLQCR